MLRVNFGGVQAKGDKPNVSRDDWNGLVGGRKDDANAMFVRNPLQPSKLGGSGTFLAQCSDDKLRWVKPPNHAQGGKVLVTEYIIGKVGEMIGAPTCAVAVIRVPAEVVGWEFRPGHKLVEGYGNGSLAVQDALEVHALEARERDENRKRHAGVFALYDWGWGADDQWLTSESSDRQLFSHDHGGYLPDGPGWSEATIVARVDETHQPSQPVVGLDAPEVTRLAIRLDTVSRAELRVVLNEVPLSWPVSDAELSAVGFFLERRAPQVADRLRILAAGLK